MMADPTPTTKPRKSSSTASAADITVGETPASVSQSTFDKVKGQAETLVGEATDAARNAANTGKDKAAEALKGASKLADDAAKAVEEHLGATYGGYARKASESVANVANSLQSKDIDDLIADTKAFVRKSPVIAIGAAAAVGFLLTRLVKVGGGSDKA